MYIILKTIKVWKVSGTFSPADFMKAVSHLATDIDILAIGSYTPPMELKRGIEHLEMMPELDSSLFGESFDLNRRQYPEGRSFHFRKSNEIIRLLTKLCDIPQVDTDRELFFDHFILYRSGMPTLPLVNFHDAFSGGTLYLSGHYLPREIEAFVDTLRATVASVSNPEASN